MDPNSTQDEAEIQKLHSKIVEHKEVREKHSTSADKQASSQHTPTPQTATKPPPQSTLPNQAYDVIIDSFLKGTQCLIGVCGLSNDCNYINYNSFFFTNNSTSEISINQSNPFYSPFSFTKGWAKVK